MRRSNQVIRLEQVRFRFFLSLFIQIKASTKNKEKWKTIKLFFEHPRSLKIDVERACPIVRLTMINRLLDHHYLPPCHHRAHFHMGQEVHSIQAQTSQPVYTIRR